MAKFEVDDDLVELIWKRANPKPFEILTFSAALRRVIQGNGKNGQPAAVPDELDQMLADAIAASAKKAPSPSAVDWVASVPDLKSKKGLTNWQAICDYLKVETGGDSARRRLKNWVKFNRPSWPPVPSIHS